MNTIKQSGAVSLFVVIFAMLIITVITLGFTRLMMQDQMQASNNDLSQSALDSAQAGVEDAKRALLYYQAQCAASVANCATLSPQISSSVCNASIYASGAIGTKINPLTLAAGATLPEVLIQQDQSGSDTDKALSQAYTCVKVALETPDYIGISAAGETRTIPLITRPGETYDTVTIRWFSNEDVSSVAGTVKVSPASQMQNQPLLNRTSWDAATPAVIRAQLIQFGKDFTLNDFDRSKNGQSNANTVFLYPVGSGGATTGDFMAQDNRADQTNPDPAAVTQVTGNAGAPYPVSCQTSVAAGGYACSVGLKLPTPINGGERTAYLRLAALYNMSHFQIVLSNGVINGASSNIVSFKDVQPEIDSTGRANDLFRRVVSRVDLYDTTFPYPDATIEVNNSFCKDFRVTDKDYLAGSCRP